MERHMANTLKVLDILQGENAVSWVLHPDLPDHPDHALGRKLMPRGCGSIVSFGAKGGRKAGAKFIEACRLASPLAHLGAAKTHVIPPASPTHQQMTAHQPPAPGGGQEMVHLQAGPHDPTDHPPHLPQRLRAPPKPIRAT